MKKSVGAKALVYPTPVFVVGTYDKEGKPNVMTASWGGICCSDPPCVSVALRKGRYTYENIMVHKAFTVGVPSRDHLREVDYFGMVSGKKADKFAATGLTPIKSELVHAPYVEEFPFSLECKVLHTIEIGLHTLFVGEILDIKADESVLGKKGLPHMEKVRPFTYAPEYMTYYATGEFLGKVFSLGKAIKKT